MRSCSKKKKKNAEECKNALKPCEGALTHIQRTAAVPVCWKNNADVSEMNAHGHRNGRTYSKTNKKSPVVWLLVPEGSEAQLRSDSWQMHGRLVAKLNN